MWTGKRSTFHIFLTSTRGGIELPALPAGNETEELIEQDVDRISESPWCIAAETAFLSIPGTNPDNSFTLSVCHLSRFRVRADSKRENSHKNLLLRNAPVPSKRLARNTDVCTRYYWTIVSIELCR
jgi:hypothetical protein